MQKSASMGTAEDVREQIEFVRGFLTLLKETELFGPMMERALEAIDLINEKTD